MSIFIHQDSKPIRNKPSRNNLAIKEEQDKLLAGAGRFDKILNAVSSFWDGRELSEYLSSSSSLGPGFGMANNPYICPENDRVGYLDKSLCVSPTIEKHVEYFPPASSSSMPPPRCEPVKQQTSPYSHVKLPPEIRMITYSDDIPKPDLPPPPGPMLPDISGDSPLTLLAAAGIDVLENLDDTVLENLVPRDPSTGRPLTIGSLEHPDGTCRPCIFFLRAKCFKGLRCSFCHFNHTALRKQIVVPSTNPPCTSGSLLHCDPPDSAGVKPSTKTKRLRPSKRTRELIKQINAQSAMLTEPNIAEGDHKGPPLSIQETTINAASNTQVIPHHRQ